MSPSEEFEFEKNLQSLLVISPIDGRYKKDTGELRSFFSEFALLRYRLLVEIEYLIALSEAEEIPELQTCSRHEAEILRSWYRTFSFKDAQTIKRIEQETKHDLKAVEYFLRLKCSEINAGTKIPFIHFGLTSEDINNLAHALAWKHALKRVYLPRLDTLIDELKIFSLQQKNIPLLGLTHGQSATPTTLGKEFAVFFARLKRQIIRLKNLPLQGKLNGATGTWGAMSIAYPQMDWLEFSKKFILSLGLEPNLYSTQVESKDSLSEQYQSVSRINSILIDVSQDIWLYIMRGVLTQKKHGIGSSTMPHKVNPIEFENAEGNAGLSNAILNHLAQKLPVSRLQRDLSDSTVLRNQGIGLGHSLLAIKNLTKGLQGIEADENRSREELNQHWEVLTEILQTFLRKQGNKEAYEQIKQISQGQKMDENLFKSMIESLPFDEKNKQILKNLEPSDYTGLAVKICDTLL
ncbi:MAG: adenylosuccinate lyase [Candidatus Magasanikbacteria bacterium]|nr:adenylosuccinate lyase [Candidatus Magasanikbacteria bacterium]